jgi:NAD-dependent deacetylase
MEREIAEIAGHLRRAARVLFITGAGMSADSGLPTYRGIGGLYEDRFTDEEMPIEAVLSGEMLRARPELTWKYMLEVEEACRGAAFNEGHRIVARIEARKPGSWVLTQNIDGFHVDAGSRNLIEIHGRLRDLFCLNCEYARTVEDFSGLGLPPSCPECGGLVRPDVVLFGELLSEERVRVMQRELRRGFDMVFSIGTTSVFPYIAQPVLEASYMGTPTVEINPGETEVSHAVDYRLAMGAAEALGRIWEAAGLED